VLATGSPPGLGTTVTRWGDPPRRRGCGGSAGVRLLALACPGTGR